MRNINISISLAIVFALILSCSRKKETSISSANQSVKTFKMVEIPPLLIEEKEKLNYLATNYWNNFDFSDTAYIHLPEVSEKAFIAYINILYKSDMNVIHNSLRKMLLSASENPMVLHYFLRLYEKYLWDPNSPLRNDVLYEPVLKFAIESEKTEEVEKVRAKYRLDLISKNRIGEQATDFYYKLSSGKEALMYDIKKDFLILYFYNPDCYACKEITQQMKASAVIKRGLDNKKIGILAFYSDEDIEAWNNSDNQMPTEWINAYDARNVMQSQELYDLKAIPTLYLLDKEKKVLLKDIDFQYLESYLSSVL